LRSQVGFPGVLTLRGAGGSGGPTRDLWARVAAFLGRGRPEFGAKWDIVIGRWRPA